MTDIPNGIARLRAAGRHGRTVLADAQMTRTFRIGRPGVIGLAVLLLGAGCTSPIYTMERYGTAPVAQVHLGCHDTYEVFDRPDAGALLVATNALNESLAAVCGEGASGLPREERLSIGAQRLSSRVPKIDRRQVGDFRCRPHRNDSRCGQRPRDVDGSQHGIGIGRAHNAHMQLAREADIADEGPSPGQQRRILQPSDRLAEKVVH